MNSLTGKIPGFPELGLKGSVAEALRSAKKSIGKPGYRYGLVEEKLIYESRPECIDCNESCSRMYRQEENLKQEVRCPRCMFHKLKQFKDEEAPVKFNLKKTIVNEAGIITVMEGDHIHIDSYFEGFWFAETNIGENSPEVSEGDRVYVDDEDRVMDMYSLDIVGYVVEKPYVSNDLEKKVAAEAL